MQQLPTPANKISFFYHLNSHKISLYLFLILFVAQIFFWQKTQNIKPEIDLIPTLPNQQNLDLIALGDQQFLFRILAMRLQNAGDVYAGLVPLKNYDYDRIYDWLSALDKLDHVSNLPPTLAAHVYSNIDDKKKLRLIVDYLQSHATKDIDKNWWWAFQAMFFARNILHDEKKYVELGDLVAKANDTNAPFWVKYMKDFARAKNGGDCASFALVKNISNDLNRDPTKFKAEEIDFMRVFIARKLATLKRKGFDPRGC